MEVSNDSNFGLDGRPNFKELYTPNLEHDLLKICSGIWREGGNTFLEPGICFVIKIKYPQNLRFTFQTF